MQLSLAIGKEGQNARLAAKLTGWKIDIKSESQVAELMREQGISPEDIPVDAPLPAMDDGFDSQPWDQGGLGY